MSKILTSLPLAICAAIGLALIGAAVYAGVNGTNAQSWGGIAVGAAAVCGGVCTASALRYRRSRRDSRRD
jgi:hypothetical protein